MLVGPIFRMVILRKSRLIRAISLALILGGCSPLVSSPPETPKVVAFQAPSRVVVPRPQADASKLQALVTRLNDFSVELYGQVAKTQTGNLAVSPIGSFFLLEMLYEGSQGAAHDALQTPLGRAQSGLPEVGLLLWDLNALPSLSLAQRIFVDSRLELVDTYIEKVRPLLQETVEKVALVSDPAAALTQMNDWISEQTGGLLPRAITTLPPEAAVVMVSTLHFHGEWASKFDVEDTKPGDFTLSDGSVIQVPMMHKQFSWFDLFPVQNGQAVIIPYQDETEMVLLLPNEGVTPDELWSNLDGKVAPTQAERALPPITLDLPRFEFRVPVFELTNSWSKIGLESVVMGADLSPMIQMSPNDPVGLAVYHQAYISLDESGTVAAAVTSIATTPAAMGSPTEPRVIRFDRPFAFLLRHSTTGTVLMLGRVEHPTEWSEPSSLPDGGPRH